MWVIERFDKSRHERAGFECGFKALDDFLKKSANQYDKRNIGRTYVAVPQTEQSVKGFYTVSTSGIGFNELPDPMSKQLPRHPVPTALLARLAVDRTEQGKGLGALLLQDAIRRIVDLSERIGIFAIVVDAIDDNATAFYRKYGFIALVDQPLKLFLPIATAAAGSLQDPTTSTGG